MARAYSQDLRARVLEAAAKGMSARQAAETPSLASCLARCTYAPYDPGDLA